VPRSGLDDGFYAAGADTSYRHWSVLDIDGDGAADLVQSGDVSHPARIWDPSGEPYWKVFRNVGTGFDATLYRWSVPANGAEGYHASRATVSYDHWLTRDVDGDGLVDLVHTADPATGRIWDASASPYWKVYRGAP
jgi:hypothetical protein